MNHFKHRHAKQRFSAAIEYLKGVAHTVFWGGLWVAIMAAAYRVWVDIHNPRLFPIRQVVVVARSLHVPRAELEKTVYAHLNGTLITLNESALKASLMKMPWVENVSIRRVWPGQLKIQITEQIPVARWGSQSLMNERTEVFSPSPNSFPQGLPLLSGPQDSQAEVWQAYHHFNQVFAPLDLQVMAVQLSTRHSWQFLLSNGIEVVLGREELESRLRRFIKLYPRLFAARADEIAQVDLRYPNGFAVKWKLKQVKPSA